MAPQLEVQAADPDGPAAAAGPDVVAGHHNATSMLPTAQLHGASRPRGVPRPVREGGLGADVARRPPADAAVVADGREDAAGRGRSAPDRRLGRPGLRDRERQEDPLPLLVPAGAGVPHRGPGEAHGLARRDDRQGAPRGAAVGAAAQHQVDAAPVQLAGAPALREREHDVPERAAQLQQRRDPVGAVVLHGRALPRRRREDALWRAARLQDLGLRRGRPRPDAPQEPRPDQQR
mmetsp:Transcript_56594/g.177756  ORF Transcript_56594/g.177756 Transcript_56594/m.177756 type:complete len:234 (-) Transcript_56594:164-865(-)